MDFITYIASIPTLEEMEERKTFCFLWSVLNREKNGNRSPIILYIFPFSMAPGKISLIVLKFLYRAIEWHLNFGNRPGNLGDHRGGGEREPPTECVTRHTLIGRGLNGHLGFCSNLTIFLNKEGGSFTCRGHFAPLYPLRDYHYYRNC